MKAKEGKLNMELIKNIKNNVRTEVIKNIIKVAEVMKKPETSGILTLFSNFNEQSFEGKLSKLRRTKGVICFEI